MYFACFFYNCQFINLLYVLLAFFSEGVFPGSVFLSYTVKYRKAIGIARRDDHLIHPFLRLFLAVDSLNEIQYIFLALSCF